MPGSSAPFFSSWCARRALPVVWRRIASARESRCRGSWWDSSAATASSGSSGVIGVSDPAPTSIPRSIIVRTGFIPAARSGPTPTS